VVLCTIETLRRDHTSLYGYGRATTPFLEALAKESLVFEEAYSQSSWTRPSMATVLTGLYASQHGTVQGTDRLPGAFVLISELLREAGYATAACCGCETISKPTFNYDQGFDLFVDEGSATFEKTRQDALEWLAADEGRPFFLFIHVFDPHEPYDAPLPFRDVFDPQYDGRLKAVSALSPSGSAVRVGLTDRDRQYIKARYDAEIYYVDTVLEGLVAQLKERGLWDDTLLVVTSDHGEEFGEHGDWGHGKTLFPQSLAVPLLIKLPAQAHGGRRVLGLAGGVDIVPTILAALGVDAPAYLPGMDLLESAVRTGRTSRQAHAAELWDIGADRRGEPAYSIISEGFQFILPRAYAPETQYLFNLREDPSGRTNLISSRLDVAERLRLMVEQRYGCVGYTLAANGSGAGPHVFSVTVTSEAAITETEGVRIEPDDAVRVSEDAHTMQARLTVAGDDDAVRFRTEPPNVPVTIAVQLDGADAPADLVRLGPSGEAPKRLPLAVPAQRSAVDADTSEARLYKVGGELGLFIWRNGTPRGSQAADLDEETLRALKQLGYL
jgi:arylsulfatase A-like enzyme